MSRRTKYYVIALFDPSQPRGIVRVIQSRVWTDSPEDFREALFVVDDFNRKASSNQDVFLLAGLFRIRIDMTSQPVPVAGIHRAM